ncbi:unnamed protein product, partial [Mesorhabditis belari]|uniref:Uncharacterized protein n=1 Tax=Mesorhabditis belari TaxID=2138241 RepID=A0AAF3ELK1_9BILA
MSMTDEEAKDPPAVQQSFLIFDGASLLYVLTIFLTTIIIMGIFAKRQIVRHRVNFSRKVPEVRLKAIAPKKVCDRVNEKLEQVQKLRQSYLPKLTDCLAIQSHNKKPYLQRMIALDEITMGIDDTMTRINTDYARLPGETTYKYLLRLKKDVLPGLSIALVQRIAYLHESARYRPERFDVPELMELRSLLAQFLKIVNSNGSKITPQTPEKTPKGPLSQWRVIGSGNKRQRRTPFGGSDGGRLLVQSGYVTNNRGAGIEEQIALLPIGSSSTEATPKKHVRHQSDMPQRSKEI